MHNLLCYFRHLNSVQLVQLFAVTAFFGCKLLSREDCRMEDNGELVCVRYMVVSLQHTLSSVAINLTVRHAVFNEISRRASNFVLCCFTHNSNLIRSITEHDIIMCARCSSTLGYKSIFCANGLRFINRWNSSRCIKWHSRQRRSEFVRWPRGSLTLCVLRELIWYRTVC